MPKKYTPRGTPHGGKREGAGRPYLDGSPPGQPQDPTDHVYVHLPASVKTAFQAKAEAAGTTMSDLIRSWISDFLDESS